MQGQENIVVGLDIGTTKICAVVGELSHGKINIIGIGTHPSIACMTRCVRPIQVFCKAIENCQHADATADILVNSARLDA